MKNDDAKPDPLRVIQLLLQLVRKLQSVQRRASAIEEELDAIIRELEELVALIGPAEAPVSVRLGRIRQDAAQAERRRILKLRAQPGAISVDIKPQSDGHSLVEIDRRTGVLVPQFIAALAAVLAENSGTKADEFVGFKSFEAIRAALRESTGQVLSDSAIKELVHRFRKLLDAHDESRYFVENKRGYGYRFRLRRPPGGMTGDDHR